MCEQLMLQLQKEQHIEAGLRDDVEKLRTVQRQLPDKVGQIRQEVTAVKDETTRMKNSNNISTSISDPTVLAEKEKEKKQVTFELTKGISFYNERLGLEFQRVERMLNSNMSLLISQPPPIGIYIDRS